MRKVHIPKTHSPEERAEISRKNGANSTGVTAYDRPPKQKHMEPNEYDFSELYSSKARYTAEQKLGAVTAYVMTGSCKQSGFLTGFSHQLISDWKNKSTWWPDAYSMVKKEKQDEMDGVMTAIVHSASGEILDRIQHGDEVIDKNGEIVRRKMSGKELATVMGITYDKRALLRGDPTSRTEKVDTVQLLQNVREQLAEIARDHLDKSVVTVNPRGK